MIVHVNEIAIYFGEKGRVQILVETFTRKSTRWWGTHQPHLQTWIETLTYFIQRFGGKKIIEEDEIKKILPRKDPQEHIKEFGHIYFHRHSMIF